MPSTPRPIQENLQHDDVVLTKHDRIFDEYRTVDKVLFDHKSMNPEAPEWLTNVEREICRFSKVAVILLYEPEKDVVLLNRQFRMGAYLAGDDNPYMLECAAGCIDEGETAEHAAIREGLEETGATVTDIEYITHVFPSAGSTDEVCYLFCGRIDSVPDKRYHGLVEEGEEIEILPYTAQEIEDLLDSGTVHNAKALILMGWFLRNRDRLREKWKQD